MPDIAARAAALRNKAAAESLPVPLAGGFDDAWGLQHYLNPCWAYPILYPPFESARTRVEDAACAILAILRHLWESAGYPTRWTSMQASTAHAKDDVADQLILWAANERFVAADRNWTAIEAEIRPGATYVQCPALDLHRMLYQPPRVCAGEGEGTASGMAPIPAYLWGAALMQHPWSGGTGVGGTGDQNAEVTARLLDAIVQDRAERHLGSAPVMGAETARRIFRILSWPAWGWAGTPEGVAPGAENLDALITLFRPYPLAGNLWDELTVALVSSPAEDLQAYGIALTEALDREAPRAAARPLIEEERIAPLPEMMALGRSLRDHLHPCVIR